MYYLLLNSKPYRGGWHNGGFDATWRFVGHNDACGGGGWLGVDTLVGLVQCGGGVGWMQWWCLGVAMELDGCVEVGCGGLGGLCEMRPGFSWERKSKKIIFGIWGVYKEKNEVHSALA